MARAPKLDFSRSQISRYIQLSALFRTQTGEWPVGSQIPTVDELAKDCGVARATVRQALDSLCEDGLIERFRAKGTFVKERVEEEAWAEITTEWSSMLRPPAIPDARIEVLSKDVKGMKLPIKHQHGTPAPAYIKVRRRHWRGKRPYLVVNLYLDASLYKKVAAKDFASKTALGIISDILPSQIADAQHIMTIGSADLVTAEVLNIAINAPVVYVRREIVDKKGTLVMVSDGIYPGDVVRIDIKIR